MDHHRPSSDGSSQDQIQNPFATPIDAYGNNSNARHHYSTPSDQSPGIVPDSPSHGAFPFYTNGGATAVTSNGYNSHSQSSNSIHQRRSNGAVLSRPGTTQSHLSAGNGGGDMLTFSPRPRNDPPPASFMGPPRIGSMASRDSAFAAPPVRHATPSINDNGGGARSKPVKAHIFKSTALVRDADGKTNISKPWLEKKDPYIRISYWLTWSLFLLLGLGGSALAIFLSWRAFPKIPNYCLAFEDNFDSLNTNDWTHEVDLGGFGNHQFDMAVADEKNSYVKDGKLYITPTLTADEIGADQLLDGPTFNLTDCTNLLSLADGSTVPNPDACGVVPNRTEGIMIPPIRSARLTTKRKHNIAYGKVTVRAKLPRGDWLWPAIWMLPEENFYGEWPMSGEIDIMEARGNDRKYPAQGRDYVRGSLNWGPTTFMNAVSKTYGWWFERRKTFDQGFHDYTLEWTPDFMWIYVDSRLHRSLDISFTKPFFDRGGFPTVITNTTTGQQTVLQNPWKGGPNSAPFDRSFYLILNVAVGGTNGWFPDGAGDKPWLDGSKTAMIDFWNKKEDWLPTWGDSDAHSMVVDSVKMYNVC
ncbi:hypothetical protein FRC18_001356 [Serendipita sp. 400]|nr:hypothetical protein FRC18_001356 [Serendipita sp. 400]